MKMFTNLDKRHPRLLLTDERLGRILDNLCSDQRVKRWYQLIKQRAEAEYGPVVYEDTVCGGDTMSPYSFAGRIADWAFMYLAENKRKYLDRCLAMLFSACEDFPDWGDRGLYVGLMNFAVSIGYDWLHRDLSPDERERIKNGIRDKGLMPVIEAYRGYEKGKKGLGMYTRADHNQNAVLSAGAGLSALAIADDEEELAEEMLQNVLFSLPLYLNSFAPDGAYMEGPLYWTFGMGVTAVFLNSLKTALGTDFDLWSMPGLRETGYFPMYMLSPHGLQFNYGDANPEFIREDKGGADALFELSRAFGNPDFHAFNTAQAENDPRVWSIIGYDPDLPADPSQLNILRDRVFYGAEQVGSMRSRWSSSAEGSGLYLAFKGGKGALNHGDMDAGTFVLDDRGERWVWDLGRDVPYPPVGGKYWWNSPGDARWSFYRKRAEGHNTIVINPDGRDGQDIAETAEIIEFASSNEEGRAVIDLSPAYRIYGAETVIRTFRLFDNRRKAEVRDSIQLSRPSELWWFLHTKAQISITEEKQQVELSLGKKSLLIDFHGAEAGEIIIMKAEPLPASPEPAGPEQSRDEFRKLAVHFSKIKEVRLSAVFSP